MLTNSSGRILLTDVGYKHTLAAARALSKAGYLVDVIGSKYSYTALSKYVSKNVFSNETLTEANINSFIDFLATSKYLCVIPIGGKSVQLISNNREKISKFTNVCLAPSESINICLNKVQTLDFAKELNIRIPKTFAKSDIYDYEKYKNINFPVVVKSSLELERFDPIYCDTYADLLSAVAQDSISKFEYIVQERIIGSGEAFFGLYQNAILKDYFMHERIREWPITGGPSTFARSINKADLFYNGNLLLQSLNWHGVAMVEFKRESKTGDLYLMEVNPKFWGSLDLSISAGINFPRDIAEICQGKELVLDNGYQIGVKFQWPLDGDFKVGLVSINAFFRFLTTLLNPSVKKNIEIRDLGPTILSLIIKIFFKLTRIPGFRWALVYVKRIRRMGFENATARFVGENLGIPLMHYSKITDYLFLGAQPKSLGFLYLKLRGVSGVLNVRKEKSAYPPRYLQMNFQQVPVVEFSGPDLEEILVSTKWIRTRNLEKEKIYVHCKEGVGRAATIVISYLVQTGMSLDDSIKIVTECRPFISLTETQLLTLKNYCADK